MIILDIVYKSFILDFRAATFGDENTDLTLGAAKK